MLQTVLATPVYRYSRVIKGRERLKDFVDDYYASIRTNIEGALQFLPGDIVREIFYFLNNKDEASLKRYKALLKKKRKGKIKPEDLALELLVSVNKK